MIFCARELMSCTGTNIPVSSGEISSLAAGTSKAITGALRAKASIKTSPKGSYKEGNTKISDAAINAYGSC